MYQQHSTSDYVVICQLLKNAQIPESAISINLGIE